MALIVDASLIIATLVAEADTERARLELRRHREGLFGPPHLTTEVANALLMKQRRKIIDQAYRDDALSRFVQLEVTVIAPPQDGSAALAAMRLADRHLLTFYDAAYLELAMRTGRGLGTLDGDLRTAALAEGVGVAPA